MELTVNFSTYTKRRLRNLLPVLLVVIFFLIPTVASAQSSPLVRSMDVNATIQKNGDLSVSETIMYNFTDQRTGFVRSFFVGESDPQSVEVDSVERNGLSDRFQVTEGENITQVSTGYPDISITGRHEYVIDYSISSIVAQDANEDSLEWQPIGGFSAPIEQANISLALPEEATLQEAHCWYDRVGGRECSVQRVDGELAAMPRSIQAGQSIILTAQLSPEATEPETTLTIAEAGSLGALVFVLVAVVAGGWIMYRRRQHFANLSVQATNSPPGGIHPIFVGPIAFGKLFAGDIAGGLIYMASRGKLKLERTDTPEERGRHPHDDLQLTLTTSLNRVRNPIERRLLTAIFGEEARRREKIRLSDLSESGSLQEDFRELEDIIDSYLVKNGLVQPPRGKTWWGYVIAAVVALVAGVIAGGWWLATGLLISIASLTVVSLLPKRTYRGQEIRQQLRGFGWFLQSTREERSQLQGIPTNLSTREFTRLLPYAVAFNLEKQWGAQFSNAYVNVPYWYSSVETVDHQTVAPVLAEEVYSLRTVIATWTDHATQTLEIEVVSEMDNMDINILEK